LAGVLLFIRYVADPLTERMARAPELLIGFAIALAALFAAIGNAFGFGKELGGLLAGIALASTPFRDAIAARLAPLRDFLLLFFFIALGSELDLANLGQSGRCLRSFVGLRADRQSADRDRHHGCARLSPRTGFLAGLTVAQISEFSLIFMAMGVTLGHVTSGARPRHPGRPDHHRRLDLHDHLLAPTLCTAGADAADIREKGAARERI
jgi:predicted Kef-type K+ transport protein